MAATGLHPQTDKMPLDAGIKKGAAGSARFGEPRTREPVEPY